MASTTKSKGPSPDSMKQPESRKKAEPSQEASGPQPPRPSATRETIESIAVAFVLAFLFKTFEAEAFVIPTGSMAPTLMGRHKDVTCTKCGFHWAIGASDEVESETDYLLPGPNARIETAICPNCRYPLPRDYVFNLPVYKGDRILVTKFSYEVSDPKRWDVVVFKYPEEPKTNYIKRLIGRPNETLEIRQGDVYRVADSGTTILRKDDPYKQKQLQLTVYDDDHPERQLVEAGWPERWAAVKKSDAPDAIAGWSPDAAGWTSDEQGRTYHLDLAKTADSKPRWLRYRNYVPDDAAWRSAEEGHKPTPPRPQLITDFCGYNAYSTGQPRADDLGVYWVGDLTINCNIDVQNPKSDAQVLLELNEGARNYRCRIELATGRATLGYTEPHDANEQTKEHVLASGDTRFSGAGRHDVTFANVDDRLCLWIDGRLIDMGNATSYSPYGGLLIQRPWDEDLIPTGVAAQGADVTVSHLLVQRDIYYRNDFVYTPPGHFDDGSPYSPGIEEYDSDKSYLTQKLSNPGEWFREYERGLSSKKTGSGEKYENVPFQFTMGPDEFFVMGDNSPRSKDSRLWSNGRGAIHRHAVPRIALVGKAFFVYWPHGVPFMNDGRGYPDSGDSIWNNPLTARFFYHQIRNNQGQVVFAKPWYPKLRVPFYPNFKRMRRIR